METRYLVLLPLQPVGLGPYQSGTEHCTVMYWFTLGTVSVPDLLAGVRALSIQYLSGGITLEAEKRADNFGPNGDVSVQVLKKNPVLIQFHLAVKAFLDGLDCKHVNVVWVGEGYRAHVTIVENHTFFLGTAREITQLAVLQDSAEGKYIIDVVELKK